MRHTTVTDEASYAQWAFEHRSTADLIQRVEASERALLEAIGCPTDPVAIYDILTGKKQPAPWPKRTAARDRARALHAMHVIVRLAAVRRAIALGEENARLAAYDALLAGLYANNGALEATLGRKIRAKNTASGRKSREKKTAAEQKRETLVRSEAQRLKSAHPSWTQRALAARVALTLKENTNTVRSILRRPQSKTG